MPSHVGIRTVTHVPDVPAASPSVDDMWDVCVRGGAGFKFDTHAGFTVNAVRHMFVMRWTVEYASHATPSYAPGHPHTATCPDVANDTIHETCVELHVKSTGNRSEAVGLSVNQCIRCGGTYAKINKIFEDRDADVSNLLSTYAHPYAYGRLIMWSMAELVAKFSGGNTSVCGLVDASRVDILGVRLNLAMRMTLRNGVFSSYYNKYGFRPYKNPASGVDVAELQATLNAQLREQLTTKTVRDIADLFSVRTWSVLNATVQPEDTLDVALQKIRDVVLDEDTIDVYASMLSAMRKSLVFPQFNVHSNTGNLWDACVALSTMRTTTAEFLRRCREMQPSPHDTVAVSIPRHQQQPQRVSVM
jgi:hypothetical protein